ncbi:MAG: hypothetical protein JW857_08580 [Bacteroidales bacterium]|nr:hypothetical protein [Bacteroidales bacterium]
MKQIFVLLLFAIIFLPATRAANELDSILRILDEVIENDAVYVARKKQTIDKLHQMLFVPNLTLKQQYDINKKLYNEYKTFISDSALMFAHRNCGLAARIGDKKFEWEANIDLSVLYSQNAMFFEAKELLDSISGAYLNGWLKIKYFEAYKYLYSIYPTDSKHHQKFVLYRDSLLMMPNKEQDFYKINLIEKLIDSHRYDKARAIAIEMLEATYVGTQKYAILTNIVGRIYMLEKNQRMQIKYYAISAICDAKNAIKENLSIKALAIAFYKTGNIDLAYKYIHKAMEDALFGNIYFRTVEISQIMHVIEGAYQQKIKTQNRNLFVLLLIISLLLVFLIVAVVLVYKQMKSTERTQKSLHLANINLKNINVKMVDVNNRLKDSNRLKEEYVARYMDESSSYLSKLDEYRKTLNRIASTGKLDELYSILKSSQFFEDEIRDFYTNFDKSFLEIFPTFVTEFNKLLRDDSQITPKPKDLLNTELRIFALIRIGITDITKIAQFLRSSTSTIYTYKTKIRKKSLYMKNDFEEMIMKIGLVDK